MPRHADQVPGTAAGGHRAGPEPAWHDPASAWPEQDPAWSGEQSSSPRQDPAWPGAEPAWHDPGPAWPEQDPAWSGEQPSPPQDPAWPGAEPARSERQAAPPDSGSRWPTQEAGWPAEEYGPRGMESLLAEPAGTGDSQRSSMIRGYPPEPGEPPPRYGPPFTAWNPPADGDRRPRQDLAAGTRVRDEDPLGMTAPARDDSEPSPADASPPGARTPGRSAGHTARGRGEAAKSAADGGARRSRSGRPRVRHSRPQVVLAVGAALLIIAASVAYLLSGSGTPRPVAGAKPPPSRPAAPSPSPSLGPWQRIGTRSTDPVALGLAELFPASFSSSGRHYVRTAIRQSADCPLALIGAGLRTAVKLAGCSQVERASYLSTSAHVMGTIGVLNLRTYQAATRAGKATGRASFIAQLKSRTGPTRRLGTGTGIEEALVKGHYLILVWAQFTTLRAPATAAQRLSLATFLNVLIQQTANVSLSYRMVNGKPAAPAG